MPQVEMQVGERPERRVDVRSIVVVFVGLESNLPEESTGFE
jgi:hypothetical protein